MSVQVIYECVDHTQSFAPGRGFHKRDRHQRLFRVP